MAKQSFHRFSTMREFGEYLQKGLRNESIELFDDTRIATRLQRAHNAFEGGDYEFATEVLGGLEAEGYLHPDMELLRRRLDQSIRAKTTRQLLENARRYFREDEPQLALQKIQELLQIEPKNTDALTLKAEIEHKRSTEQIAQWLKLAQQHLENHSYSHARQALEKVLQLRPSDSRALKQLDEINLQEQEYTRLRKEKEDLYYSAVDAWRKGEVSAALSELERVLDLDRRAPDTSAPERAARYQNFYNQVRSDHDLVKNAYEEASKQLAARNFKAALAICDEHLGKYPGNALFQALKVDVEECQRQEFSAYIARIDREVDAEPDLERRLSILREALVVHPNEAHFERSLRLTTAKRDLVNGIVGKARSYEERGLFNEALGQWEMLRTIYGLYPGLGFEVERVIKRREQQARSEAKARWVEQIDRCLTMGEWQRALDLTQTALGEFRDDTELKALEKLSRQSLERTAESQRLLEQGRVLCAAGQTAEGLAVLREAHELDDRSSSIRTSLVETLLKEARRLLDTDWHAADELTTHALDLEPGNSLAKSLQTLLDDHRRSEFVDRCLGDARQKQAAGDLQGAMAVVSGGLKSYPNETRLTQVRLSLERSLTEQHRTQVRRRDLEEARELEKRAQRITNSEELQTILSQTLTIAHKHAGDRDFQSILGFLQDRLESAKSAETEVLPAQQAAASAPGPQAPPALPASTPQPATAPEPPRMASASATAPPSTPPKSASAISAPKAAAVPAAMPEPPSTTAPPASVASQPAAKPGRAEGKGFSPLVLAAAGGVVLLLLALFVVPRFFTTKNVTVPVRIVSEPAGATVLLDGQQVGVAPLSRQLPAGSHQLSLVLDGYDTAKQDIGISAGSSCCGTITLRPLSAVARIWSDLPGTTVALDGQDKGAVAPGQALELSGLTPGDHTLTVKSMQLESSLVFTAAVGAAPGVTLPVPPRGMNLFAAGTLSGRGRFYSSKPVKISWNNQPAQDAGPDGFTFDGLKSGTLALGIDEGDNKVRSELLDIGSAPVLTVFVRAPMEKAQGGGIVIRANEGGFKLLIDGRQVAYRPHRDGFIAMNVPVGKHVVQLEKEGYRLDPPKQTVQLESGKTAAIEFQLAGLPAALAISGALSGTQVFVNGELVGTTGDGPLRVPGVSPGDRRIELRKRGWRPKSLSVTIPAGGEGKIDTPQSVLERVGGVLLFQLQEPKKQALRIDPAKDVIDYEGPRQVPEAPAELPLPVGSYNLTFSAPGYVPETVSVQVGDRETKSIPSSLKKR